MTHAVAGRSPQQAMGRAVKQRHVQQNVEEILVGALGMGNRPGFVGAAFFLEGAKTEYASRRSSNPRTLSSVALTW